jgi:hypothetical protein
MNYLDIVNKALLECKVTLDPLTSANFASPPRTLLYDNFKRWANDAYRELMLERPQWFFRKERTTVKLWPRLHLSGLSYTPAPGDVLKGQTSGTQFTVIAVRAYEDNEGSTVTERTVDVEYSASSSPSNLDPNETLDRVSPAPALAVGYVAAAGRYNFADQLPGFAELDMENVNTYYEGSNAGSPLVPVAWDNWINRFNYYPYGGAANPSYITRALDGNYEIFPQPVKPFYLSFEFTRTFTDMVAFSDVPIGLPADYHQLLVWMTVAEFADFDQNTRIYSRAIKHINKYDYFLRRDALPAISMGPSKFNTQR